MRALLLWLLILAQPVYGASSFAAQLWGPAHWHEGPSRVTAVLEPLIQPAAQFVERVAQQLHAVRVQAHARAHALGARHEHHGLQRHHHAPADDSVRALGPTDPAVADLVAGAAVGSASLTLAIASVLSPGFPPAVNGRWPQGPGPHWADAEARQLLPPPRS